jgi:uncharacterized protein (DUF1778 family)
MGREDPQLKLRLTEELKSRITEAAKANGRSVNAEIVARLEAYENGGDIGQEWKSRFEDEHDAYRRMERLYDGTFDVAMNYRSILATANGQLQQYIGMVKSLASILVNLEERPGKEIVDVATRMETAATESLDRLQKLDPLEQAKRELRDLDATISKADELLKKD